MRKERSCWGKTSACLCHRSARVSPSLLVPLCCRSRACLLPLVSPACSLACRRLSLRRLRRVEGGEGRGEGGQADWTASTLERRKIAARHPFVCGPLECMAVAVGWSEAHASVRLLLTGGQDGSPRGAGTPGARGQTTLQTTRHDAFVPPLASLSLSLLPLFVCLSVSPPVRIRPRRRKGHRLPQLTTAAALVVWPARLLAPLRRLPPRSRAKARRATTATEIRSGRPTEMGTSRT
jgi:hypothetical protein